MAIDFPNSPTLNQIFTSGTRSWQWDGTTWNIYAAKPVISVQDTAPTSPAAGDQWYESDTGRWFLYYDSVWIEIGNATDIAGALQPGQVTALSAVTSLTTDDVFPVIDNPSSATVANKITYGNLSTVISTTFGTYLCSLSNASVSAANDTDVYPTFSSEVYDPSNWHSTSTNTSRVTPTIAGYYLCTAQYNDTNPSSGNFRAICLISKNRTDTTWARMDFNNYAPDDMCVSGVTYLNGSSDYVEMFVKQYSGSTKTLGVFFNVMLIART